MSIWTDLLFVGGYVATPTGLAALVPPASPPPPAPAAKPSVPTATVHAMAPRLRAIDRPLPRANKISPNDLW